jgi:hypothetical protein
MKKGTYVRISKQWHKPEIRIAVTDEEIGISIDLSDFVKAIAAEVGRPIAIVTQAQLLAKLEAAADAVTLSMKKETSAVVR